jgi:hypothetical protein
MHVSCVDCIPKMQLIYPVNTHLAGVFIALEAIYFIAKKRLDRLI